MFATIIITYLSLHKDDFQSSLESKTCLQQQSSPSCRCTRMTSSLLWNPSHIKKKNTTDTNFHPFEWTNSNTDIESEILSIEINKIIYSWIKFYLIYFLFVLCLNLILMFVTIILFLLKNYFLNSDCLNDIKKILYK